MFEAFGLEAFVLCIGLEDMTVFYPQKNCH